MTKRGRPQRKWKKYSEAEIKHIIKTVNDSLYRLEKAGLQSESAEYRKIEKYAISNPNGTGKMYNVNFETGTIRVSKDLSRYKNKKERDKFVDVLENILKSQTRTVSGTRKAMQKGFETVKKDYGYAGSLKQYINVWHTFRDQVSKNKRDKIGSDVVMQLIEKTNIYTLSKRELQQAMNVLQRARTADSGVRTMFRKVKGLKRKSNRTRTRARR